MTHPQLFEGANIGDGPTRELFVDGSFGCANPVAHVFAEAATLYPERHFSCIVNIGAGHSRTIQMPKLNALQEVLPTSALATIKDIATNSERIAQEMAMRLHATADMYFRFNVDQGIQDTRKSEWERFSGVSAHTQAYMRRSEVAKELDRVVRITASRGLAVGFRRLDSRAAQYTAEIKICPIPSPVFTGRRRTVEQAKDCIARGDQERCIFVFYGLGGAGKTEIALKIVEETRDMWADVIYVDASSQLSAISSLEGFAKAKQIGEAHEDTLRWLGSHRQRWLMVLDNANDPALQLTRFIPPGNLGSILVTTRIASLASLAQPPHSSACVSGMEQEEALELLAKTAVLDVNSDAQRVTAIRLLEDLGYLALAIVQAGRYISRSNLSIDGYREIFTKQRWAIHGAEDGTLANIDNYQRSLHTAWYMSYKLLGAEAQQLLWLWAFLHYDGLTEEMLRRAAIRSRTYAPVIPPSGTEVQAQQYVKGYLRPYLDKETGAWSVESFLALMTELMSCSLVNYDKVNATYNLNILVHNWAGTIIPPSILPTLAIERTAFLLALSIDYGDTGEDHAFQRTLGVHIDELLRKQTRPNANNAALFAEVYSHIGQWSSEAEMEVIASKARREVLGEDHPRTLDTMHNLGCTYRNQGRYEKAEELQVQVLDARKRGLGDEHPNTLTSMGSLALTYRHQGRFQRAEALQVQVLGVMQRVLGEQHLDTLACANNLALTYRCLLRYDEAAALLQQALDGYQQKLGRERPETLNCMDNLALTYQDRNLFFEAGELQRQVLDTRKRTIGEQHPDTLIGMSNLAYTYQRQGLYQESKALRVAALQHMKRVLGEEHPETLSCMRNLAVTYHSLTQYEQAEELLVHVVEVYNRIFGQENPNTLNSMGSLASTYRSQSRHTLAESLEAEVENIRKKLSDRESMAQPRTQHQKDGNDQPPGDRTKVEIGQKTPMFKVIQHLTAHNCPEVTSALDIPFCKGSPTSVGGFSDIYEGRMIGGTERVAIKCLRLGTTVKIHKRAAQELYSWSRLQHDNVLQLLGLALFRGQIAMISPWMAHGNLTEYAKQNPGIDRFQLCVGVVNGLAYMHSQDVLHGDLKGENVLISDAGVPKLFDFGCSTLKLNATVGFTPTRPRYTMRWAAPELLMDDPDGDDDGEDSNDITDPMSVASDVYALGMVRTRS
ncbi:hypothetical protein FRC06_007579 [Ceratobasidium sp. 370]|nr:hypothetical protein FRC06_007579 [Ceratobasidium sp. 370]